MWMVEVQTTWGAAAAGGAGGLCLGALPWHSGNRLDGRLLYNLYMYIYYIIYILYCVIIIFVGEQILEAGPAQRFFNASSSWGSSQANPPLQRSSAWPTPSKRRSSGTVAGKHPEMKVDVGFPPNHPWINRVFHYKPSILGYPYFRKHPCRKNFKRIPIFHVWLLEGKSSFFWVLMRVLCRF